MKNYRFDDAANAIYQFFWGEFCDWYLEIVKIRLEFGDGSDAVAAQAALTTLLAVFEASLRMLAPFMPFLTEEIWQALYAGAAPEKSIALTDFVRPSSFVSSGLRTAEEQMEMLQALIVAVRALRKDLGVEEKLSVPIQISRNTALLNHAETIQRLARVSKIESVSAIADGPQKRGAVAFDVAVLYEKTIDVAAERERLTKDLAKYEKEMVGKQSQLQNDGFLAKAPANIVEGLRARADELTVLIEKTRAALDSLSAARAASE